MKTKVLVYPKDPNPYQELLYSQLRSRCEIKYLENPTDSPIIGLIMLYLQSLYYRIKGYTIFHLHWYYTFYPPFNNRLLNNLLTKTFYSTIFISYIVFIKILKYKLVWTVHNVIPLQKQFSDDIRVVKILSKLADTKIVHSKNTINKMHVLGLNTNNSHIIPHGNYIDVYKNEINRNDSRKYFMFKEDDYIFLFFGIIQQYKGVEDLLSSFVKLSKKEKNVKLLIAGRCYDNNIKQKLNWYRNEYKDSIKICNNYIDDDIVQYYYNCADVVVYPVKEITTSGSVMLAQTFGKPIICPKKGNLKGLPKDIAFLYDIDYKDGLFKTMEYAIKNKYMLKVMGINAYKYAKQFSWDKIANQTYYVYKNID